MESKQDRTAGLNAWTYMYIIIGPCLNALDRVQELCESGGGRPGLPVLMSLMVFVDVKQH